MASRPGQGGDSGRRDREAGRPVGAFSLTLRATVLAALLLLVVYTALTFARMPSASGAQASAAERLEAERLAARTAALSTAMRFAADAAAATPTDRAGAAVRLGAPFVRAAAVGRDGALETSSGDAAATAALRQALAIRAHAGTAWFGLPTQRSGAWLLAGAPSDDGSQVVVAAPMAALVRAAPATVREMLVGADGLVLASSARGPISASATLALDPEEIQAAVRSGVPAHGLFAPGRPVRVSAARTPDGTLTAIVAEPPPPVIAGRAVAGDAFWLMAPLVVGLLLTLVLMVQTRKADEAETGRRDSERKFRLAVEAARCGIWEWDLMEDQVSMSDVTAVMFGWGGGGVAAGEDVIGRIAPEHRDRVRQALRGAQEFGALDVSFCVPNASGGVSWIDARGQAFGAPAGPAPKKHARVIGVALDVTDERTAERRAQAAERRLHDAIESVSEAFVLFDRYGRLIMCNSAFRNAFSLEPRVLKPGATRGSVLKLAELAVRAHTPVANPAKPGLREVETVDGRWLQVSERRTAEAGLVMTATDVTGIKRQEEARRLNEEALQHAVARLEESRRELSDLAQKYQAEKFRAEAANTAKSEFLANMSHELRTPLNAINGFSEMMVAEMFGSLGDRRYAEYAADILTSGQHLLALINDILDMSKIEAGKMTLHLETVDAVELAQEAVRLMRNRADTAGLTLDVAASADLPTLEADYRGLKQILLNLLSNAIKFTPQGGRVTVKAAEAPGADGPRLRISVCDTGIGIAPEDLGRLARPFEQIETQHAKTQQGTGLGLALTKALVELHGGVLSIESEPGSGTAVSFTLPLRAAEPDWGRAERETVSA